MERGRRGHRGPSNPYKWVDWETRLCDWETQKQVCLYAERLPSFLLSRRKNQCTQIQAHPLRLLLWLQYIFTRRIKFSGGGDFPSQVADLPTSPILTLLVLLRRLSVLPCWSLIRSSRLLDLGNEERGGADDGLPLPDDLQVDQVQSLKHQFFGRSITIKDHCKLLVWVLT